MQAWRETSQTPGELVFLGTPRPALVRVAIPAGAMPPPPPRPPAWRCAWYPWLAADPLAQFTRACGLAMDMSAAGLGLRSQRYAMLVEDGVVRGKWVDADGRVKASSADNVLSKL